MSFKIQTDQKGAIICRFTWGMAQKNKNSTTPGWGAISRFTWRTAWKSKKKPPKITPNACLKVAANRILKKYQRQRQNGCLKNVNERTANWLKKAGYLETDYNNDVSLDDVTTVDHNMDTQPNELDNDIEKIDLKNTSKNTLTQKTAKKIVKKYRNLKRKSQFGNYSNLK